MLQASNLFGTSSTIKEKRAVRTLSFQGDTFQEFFQKTVRKFKYGTTIEVKY